MTYRSARTPAGRPMFAYDTQTGERAPVNQCDRCDALVAWIRPRPRREHILAMVSLDVEGHHGTFEANFEHTSEVCRARRHFLREIFLSRDSYLADLVISRADAGR